MGEDRKSDGVALSENDTFTPSKGLSDIEANVLLQRWGKNELPEKVTPKWVIFVEQLIAPMPIMIWIAAVTELAISNYPDMGILLGIQFINAGIGYYEIVKAGDAVAALKKQLKPEATVKRNGKWINMDATLVVPGDLVLLGAGSAVPADCIVNEGRIEVDQSVYTGASTFFGKTASMLQGEGEIGNLQKVLLRIMLILTKVGDAVSFTVVLIVASIPIAIEIVCTTTLALGSKELVTHGAIVKRLAAIEDMAGMNMLCSDKTGTLTKNKMEIQEDTPVYLEGESQYTALRYAAMATKWNEPARDALDTMTHSAADLDSLREGDGAVEQTDYMPFDPTVKRTEGSVKVISTGKEFKTTKGAPHILMALCESDGDVHRFGTRGIRALAVAKTNDDGKWQMVALLTFLDPPREDTKATIHRSMAFGVEVKMITGDHLLIAVETSKVLELGDKMPGRSDVTKKAPPRMKEEFGDYIRQGHGFAQVFPEHKYLIVKVLRELGFRVGMTGDGVNDAPALHAADVGIAVADSTDAARAASDIVLTGDGLSTIVEGIIISRCIFQRMMNFITYRIAATLQLLVFFFAEPWPRFFKMPVLMLMLITLLNDGTLISIGYDNVVPSKLPNMWNLKVVFTVSSLLAFVALLSSLLLLYWGLDSWRPDGYGQLATMMYLKVSISDFLTLFSARTHDGYFWSSTPSPILIGAACFALALSTLLACGLGSGVGALPVYVWLYCIFWWVLQDVSKVVLYKYLHAYNIFGINDAKKLMQENMAQNSIDSVENPLLDEEEAQTNRNSTSRLSGGSTNRLSGGFLSGSHSGLARAMSQS
eukprot:GSChrysophyteH1.ASY1.ANO1.2575.1 assembled CDS